MLDLLDEDLREAVGDPGSATWAELARFARAEVSQATGMLVAQLDVGPSEALSGSAPTPTRPGDPWLTWPATSWTVDCDWSPTDGPVPGPRHRPPHEGARKRNG